MLTGIRWLFFDIGSTLVDESKAYARRVRETVAGSNISPEQFYEEMLGFYRQNQKGTWKLPENTGFLLHRGTAKRRHCIRMPFPVCKSCTNFIPSV